jgi:hypothetical protein
MVKIIQGIGFKATGVTGGSLAAWLHSLIGVVAKGSSFSELQSNIISYATGFQIHFQTIRILKELIFI